MKKSSRVAACAAAVLTITSSLAQAKPAYRSVTIQTAEVTQPVIAIQPDGKTFIFTALGHLFQLPATGGTAQQLSFGPYYDSDPALSPDGREIAFVSNRDGSSANIFILDLGTLKIRQITQELEAVRPAWSPDGKTIAYFRNVPHRDQPMNLIPSFGDTGQRELRSIPAAGGAITIIAPPDLYESVFYLRDGRLGWTVREQTSGGMFPSTRATHVRVQSPDGEPNTLVTVASDLGRVSPAPAGDALYYFARGTLQHLKLTEGATPTAGAEAGDGSARLALTRDGATGYYGARGKLWRVALPSGAPAQIPLALSVKFEAREQVSPIPYQAPLKIAGESPVKPVLAPTLSPDGSRLVFMAAGFLWEQPLKGGAAQRLFDTRAFERDPVFSPDGSKLAYVADEDGQRTLRVYDFASKQTKILFTVGGTSWPLYPHWNPDGTRLVFQHANGLGAPYPIVIVNIADGKTETVAQAVGSWVARPQFSHDGRAVYFTSRPEKFAALYRVALTNGAKPEAVTALSRHVNETAVSPDGRWMAFRRNSEIWLAPLAATPVHDADLRRLSAEGGRSFAFTPDSTGIIYAAFGRMWRQPLQGGKRTEIRVQAGLPRALDPPLLIHNVHVLDYAQRGFTPTTSMYVEGGRIRWIGDAQGHALPANTQRIDAAGRYAIPGLYDMHVHSAWADHQTSADAFIAFGVTSVRDTGGVLDLLTALNDRSRITDLPTPRYTYAGEIFEGLVPPVWGDAFMQISNEQEARAEVRNFRKAGAEFIKVYPSLPWHLQQVVADEAHRVGLPLVGHGLSLEELTKRVLLGFTTIEHGNATFAGHDDLYKMLAATHTAVDPTLSVFGGALMRAMQPGWESDWRVQSFVPAEARQGGGGLGRRGAANETVDQIRADYRGTLDGIMAAQKDHVLLLGGTDAMMGGVFFGLSAHWELAQFVDAGMQPIDALRNATEEAATIVGAGRDLGSLTAGKLADLILLDANPLENIRNTQQIWQVIKGGHVYDPKTLRRKP